MHTYGFFVSFPGTLLQRLPSSLQVLVQELTHDNARREGNEVFLSRYGFHEILCAILAGRAIDAAPLPPARCLYPVTCLPSSVGPFTRSAPVAICVLSGHEQPPSCSRSGYRWGSRWWSSPVSPLFGLSFYLQKSGLRRSWYTPVYKRYLLLGAGPCGGAAGGGGGCGIALPKLPPGIHYGKGGQKRPDVFNTSTIYLGKLGSG